MSNWKVTSSVMVAACSPNSSSSCRRTVNRTRRRWVRGLETHYISEALSLKRRVANFIRFQYFNTFPKLQDCVEPLPSVCLYFFFWWLCISTCGSMSNPSFLVGNREIKLNHCGGNPERENIWECEDNSRWLSSAFWYSANIFYPASAQKNSKRCDVPRAASRCCRLTANLLNVIFQRRFLQTLILFPLLRIIGAHVVNCEGLISFVMKERYVLCLKTSEFFTKVWPKLHHMVTTSSVFWVFLFTCNQTWLQVVSGESEETSGWAGLSFPALMFRVTIPLQSKSVASFSHSDPFLLSTTRTSSLWKLASRT